eukprot:2230406-Alexandrium_andersonii.AAC.1
MPERLIGMSTRTDGGQAICYGLNLKECSKAPPPGKTCDRGLHVCGKCCKSDHAFVDCRN